MTIGSQPSRSDWDLQEVPLGTCADPLRPGFVPEGNGPPARPSFSGGRQQSCPMPFTPTAASRSPVAPAPRTAPWLQYSATLAVGVAALILLVGFLAWNIPFGRLQGTIEPLGGSIRRL
eukprot:EG_transcript_53413